MRFHWQNLNERPHGQPDGTPLKRGRAWLEIGRLSLQWEWSFRLGRPELGVTFSTGGIHQCSMLCFSFLVGQVFLGFHHPWLSRVVGRAQKRDGYKCGAELDFEDGPTLRLDFASRDFSFRSADPWWVRGKRINLWDVLFGRTAYKKSVLREKFKVHIPMPEGSYEALADEELCEWKRPRLPWRSIVRHGWAFEVPGGIPFAGKGENAWDCGDDGLYGAGSSKKHLSEAIGDVVASVLRSRERYGTASWLRDTQPVMARKPEAVS